jgi:hypothetical protein
MRQRNRSMRILALTLGISVALGGCALFPPADDNEDYSFFRQAVPKLLGRQAKGADEVKLLADLVPLVGRDGVLRMLMEQPEFTAHWTNVMLDILQVQRDGVFREQDPACFGDRVRTAAATPNLADHVRSQAPDVAAPGGDFNMIDLIESALVLDDLSPIYRAYPIPLTYKIAWGSEAAKRGDAAYAFNHAMLNRQIDCLECHNSRYSRSGSSAWNRHHPIRFALEKAVYGSNDVPVRETFYNVFRQDQLVDDTANNNTAVHPWGMTSATGACGKILMSLPTDPNSSISTFFAGATGNQVGLIDVVTKLKTGSEALKLSGMTGVIPSGGGLPEVPAAQLDRAYAYMVALTITDNVWEQLMGEKLTIINYFPRNADQLDALKFLTEAAFIGTGYSLKDLIATIMVGNLFNRRAPDLAAGATPYRLKMIFDPWAEKDPRDLLQPAAPENQNNGQGDMVHRYAPTTLLRSAASALDWPGPKRFPNATDYPNSSLVKAIGQYTSDFQPGTRAVTFQGLLTWESQQGVCENKNPIVQATGQPGPDWIDRLIDTGIPAFNNNNPLDRLKLRDLVLTMKDWIIGEQTISSANTIAGNSDEERALAALFGVSTNSFGVINTPTNGVPFLKDKARRYCGALLLSPRFMLAGIEPSTGMNPPRLRVCNGSPCTYLEMCTVYRDTLATMGITITCHDGSVTEFRVATDPDGLCPQAFCVPVSSNSARFCERNARSCDLGPMTLRAREQRHCGARGCGPSWFDTRKPAMFIMQAEGAAVRAAQNVQVKPQDATAYRALRQGEALRAGDVLRLPPGGVFEARADRRVFASPKTGMPSKFTRNQAPIDRDLITAVERGSDSVAGLLDKGANIHTRDRFGETPLMKAAAAGNAAMVELLLRRGAELSAQDARGFTAADAAAARKQSAVVGQAWSIRQSRE